jgi:hypothetical protein
MHSWRANGQLYLFPIITKAFFQTFFDALTLRRHTKFPNSVQNSVCSGIIFPANYLQHTIIKAFDIDKAGKKAAGISIPFFFDRVHGKQQACKLMHV